MGVGIYGLGRVQGWDQENQGTDVAELGKVQYAKNNREVFYRYISQKGKSEESVPSDNKMGELLTADMEKAEVLNNIM